MKQVSGSMKEISGSMENIWYSMAVLSKQPVAGWWWRKDVELGFSRGGVAIRQRPG